MPKVTRKITRPATNDALKRRLIDEWTDRGSQEPRPYIIEEQNDRGITAHVYVVWDEWGGLDQQARSEVITEAFWEVYGSDKGLELLIAMGLTAAEADRMGIRRS